jgi:hypothetical protein
MLDWIAFDPDASHLPDQDGCGIPLRHCNLEAQGVSSDYNSYGRTCGEKLAHRSLSLSDSAIYGSVERGIC